MSTEVFTCDAARRSRHQPKSMWTRRSMCAFTPRSQPESLLPGSPSVRRPRAAIDESMTRACPHDIAVQLFYCLLPGCSLSAQHQAVLCQSSPGPKTRLAAPPGCVRPAPTVVVRPPFPAPCLSPPKLAAPLEVFAPIGLASAGHRPDRRPDHRPLAGPPLTRGKRSCCAHLRRSSLWSSRSYPRLPADTVVASDEEAVRTEARSTTRPPSHRVPERQVGEPNTRTSSTWSVME